MPCQRNSSVIVPVRKETKQIYILIPLSLLRYLTTFDYVHLRAQHEVDRKGEVDKEFVWPNSFADCTPQLS